MMLQRYILFLRKQKYLSYILCKYSIFSFFGLIPLNFPDFCCKIHEYTLTLDSNEDFLPVWVLGEEKV
jgi:hypothetical protein